MRPAPLPEILVSISGYRIRRATGADADAITRHRVAIVRDMSILDERDAGTLAATSLTYFEEALPSGAYVGWVVEREHRRRGLARSPTDIILASWHERGAGGAVQQKVLSTWHAGRDEGLSE